jgi:hypothetical protein
MGMREGGHRGRDSKTVQADFQPPLSFTRDKLSRWFALQDGPEDRKSKKNRNKSAKEL